MAACPHCAVPVHDAALVCPSCGHRLGRVHAMPALGPEAADRAHGRLTMLWALLAVAVLFAVLWAAYAVIE